MLKALHGPAQRAFMRIFAGGLELLNIIVLLLKQARTPILYAHICTSEVYIASREYHCVVALQGGLGLPCRADQMTIPIAYAYYT